MEDKEIEQRIDDAVNEIPLESILQESKNKLEEKMERYEKYKPNFYNRAKRRIQAHNMHKAKNIKNKCIALGVGFVRLGILIVLGIFVYHFIIQKFFN